jgi:putative transposase
MKLELNNTQQEELLKLSHVYRDAMNYAFLTNFVEKTTNIKKLHAILYHQVRSKFGLPAQFAVNVHRDCGSAYKTWWAQVKEYKRRGKDKRVSKMFKKPIKRKSLTVSYTMNRTFSINLEKLTVSLTGMNGRLKNIDIKGWDKHYHLLRTGKIGDPKLIYTSKREFFLLIPVTLPVTPKQHKEIIGLDVGERHIGAVASSKGTRTLIDLPGTVKSTKKRYHDLRSELMSKGTRSSRSKLRKVRGREKRFVSDTLHSVTKNIVSTYPEAHLYVEDLVQIRANRITYRGKNKEHRRVAEQWPFAEFQNKLGYKNIYYNGIPMEKVDPHYTSQRCPVCGNTTPDNRPNHGEVFLCTNCRYTEHADVVGAINILLNGIIKDQDESIRIKGLLVNQPIVPCDLG